MFNAILCFCFGVAFLFHALFVPLFSSWLLTLLAAVACFRASYCVFPDVRARWRVDFEEAVEAERRRRQLLAMRKGRRSPQDFPAKPPPTPPTQDSR